MRCTILGATPLPSAAAVAPVLPARALGAASTSTSSQLAPAPPRRQVATQCLAGGLQQPGGSGSWLSSGSRSGGGSQGLRRRQLGGSSRRLLTQQPPPPRAADIVGALEAGADDDGGSPALSHASASTAWQLGSPYDKEIFLLAIPALFRWAGGAGGSSQGGGAAGQGQGKPRQRRSSACTPGIWRLMALQPARRCPSTTHARSCPLDMPCNARGPPSFFHPSFLPPPSLLPPPCSVLLDPIMGMVSTAIVGSTLGTQALAAVGLCTIVFNFSK